MIQYRPEGFKLAIVHVGVRNCHIMQGWCFEFSNIFWKGAYFKSALVLTEIVENAIVVKLVVGQQGPHCGKWHI